jgi:hypothetical protein
MAEPENAAGYKKFVRGHRSLPEQDPRDSIAAIPHRSGAKAGFRIGITRRCVI